MNKKGKNIKIPRLLPHEKIIGEFGITEEDIKTRENKTKVTNINNEIDPDLSLDDVNLQAIIDSMLEIEQEHLDNSSIKVFDEKKIRRIINGKRLYIPFGLNLIDTQFIDYLFQKAEKNILHSWIKRANSKLIREGELKEIVVKKKRKMSPTTLIKDLRQLVDKGYIVKFLDEFTSERYLLLDKSAILIDKVIKIGYLPAKLYDYMLFLIDFMQQVEDYDSYFLKQCPECGKVIQGTLHLRWERTSGHKDDLQIVWKCGRHYKQDTNIELPTALMGWSKINRLLWFL